MNKYLKFKSILTKNLTTYNIEKILSLKKQVYNYSLRSQKKWFTKIDFFCFNGVGRLNLLK